MAAEWIGVDEKISQPISILAPGRPARSRP
jgi:hypothetical protein